MKKILLLFLPVILFSCSSLRTDVFPITDPTCKGSADLPQHLISQFEPAEDAKLLQEALAEPDKGGLCQGKVYISKTDVPVYRSWNSTNPFSKSGKWWSFDTPAGKVASYREEFAICYQWSPLDKMSSCTLKKGTRIVVGTGQSARCSEYLTYPVSDRKQIYIPDASLSVTDCTDYDGLLNWSLVME
ncbi:hypothetical protein OOT00_05595 [Desulfobotulus sp. H1]|uniref:Lipoprotein n=1 Tax=Desulfobotulus pelophilus TaxID=2823377 RepID=A0ABT3N7M8_9BACT|nr:hypothetical protein [Desulfobotulus pelophilus]MCW7753460.1 hypothetical protein [Desulfobotulus pelophilus]